MYSNNILNFQESTPILNACTKKSRNLLNALHTSVFLLENEQTMVESILELVEDFAKIVLSAFGPFISHPPIPIWNQGTYQETWKDLNKII